MTIYNFEQVSIHNLMHMNVQFQTSLKFQTRTIQEEYIIFNLGPVTIYNFKQVSIYNLRQQKFLASPRNSVLL